MLLRIITKDPVQYSLDNGITRTEYAPGEVYSVPDWAAQNMMRRGWAKQVRIEDVEDEPEQPVNLSDLRRTETKENGT